MFDVGDDFVGVTDDVGDVVRPMDAALGVDEVAVAAREVGELVSGVPRDLVGRADFVVEIAQQPERELLRPGEGEVLRRRVE